MTWKLFDSAPKDGTKILAYKHGLKNPIFVAYFEPEQIVPTSPERPWQSSPYRLGNRWRIVGVGVELKSPPSHWMELPTIPELCGIEALP